MRKVAVFFGGDSVESDISIITGIGALSALDVSKYQPIAVYMRDNRFFVVDSAKALSVSTYLKQNAAHFKEVYVTARKLVYADSKFKKKYVDIDVAVLCNHGGIGEAGGLQGLLEANDIAYTSTDIARSAMCMDKELTHIIATKIGVSNVDYRVVDASVTEDEVQKIFEEFGESVVVKPNSLGSSVGVSAVSEGKQLFKAIQTSLRYDKKVLIERRVENLVEFNCACVADGDELIVSDVDIPCRSKDILDFDDKYLIFEGKAQQDKFVPSLALKQQVKDITQQVYKQMELFGVVRIDYLYDSESEELYMNEINTIPGSLAYYLFAGMGLDMVDLTDILITAAIKRYKEGKALIKKFDSSLLALQQNSSPKLLQKFRK